MLKLVNFSSFPVETSLIPFTISQEPCILPYILKMDETHRHMQECPTEITEDMKPKGNEQYWVDDSLQVSSWL